MYENIGHGLEQLGLQVDAMGEQQSKRAQSGRGGGGGGGGAAIEAGAINWGAAAEADTIG